MRMRSTAALANRRPALANRRPALANRLPADRLPANRLRGPALLAAALLALGGCTTAPTRAVVPQSEVTLAPDPSPTPSVPLTAAETCARVRETTGALGPAVPRRFLESGMTKQQVLDILRTVYELAATNLASYRGGTPSPQLASAIRAVEVQYADIRSRLTKPDDVTRVDLLPRALQTALANLDKVCG